MDQNTCPFSDNSVNVSLEVRHYLVNPFISTVWSLTPIIMLKSLTMICNDEV